MGKTDCGSLLFLPLQFQAEHPHFYLFDLLIWLCLRLALTKKFCNHQRFACKPAINMRLSLCSCFSLDGTLLWAMGPSHAIACVGPFLVYSGTPTPLHLAMYPESDPWGDTWSHHFFQLELKKPEHSLLPCSFPQYQTLGIKKDFSQWICNLVYHFAQVILLGRKKKHLILHILSGYSQYIVAKHLVSPVQVKGRWH